MAHFFKKKTFSNGIGPRCLHYFFPLVPPSGIILMSCLFLQTWLKKKMEKKLFFKKSEQKDKLVFWVSD